jgi:hypothetical protein
MAVKAGHDAINAGDSATFTTHWARFIQHIQAAALCINRPGYGELMDSINDVLRENDRLGAVTPEWLLRRLDEKWNLDND